MNISNVTYILRRRGRSGEKQFKNNFSRDTKKACAKK
jgi:hypothetical protein